MKKMIAFLLVLAMTACMLPALAVSASSAPALTVDGDLTDWEGLPTLSVVGSGDWEGKKVTFYGILGEDGLYLAADAYHADFKNNVDVGNPGNWWKNTNFEFFVNKNGNRDNQCWVSAQGMSDTNTEPAKSHDKMVAKMTTEKSGDLNHTVVEVFMAYADFDFLSTGEDDFLRVGVAWKTEGDICNNGEAAGGGNDEYWVPKLTWPDNNDKAHVTANGIFDRNGEPKPCQHPETEIVGAKDATATDDGYTGDKVCKDCGVTLEEGTVIPATGTQGGGNEGEGGGTTTPPQTGDAMVYTVVAAVAVLALAAVVVSKKRRIAE